MVVDIGRVTPAQNAAAFSIGPEHPVLCAASVLRGLQVANVQVDNRILGVLTNNFGTTCLPINILFGLLITECLKVSCLHNTCM